MLSGLRRWLVFGFILPMLAQVAALPTHAQPDELEGLEARVQQLHRAGKYAEAIPQAERYVALAKSRYGEEHSKYASGLHDLGVLYRHPRRYAEAEPLLQRELAIAEKALGPEQPRVGTAL